MVLHNPLQKGSGDGGLNKGNEKERKERNERNDETTMMITNFKEWEAFTFKGKRFLAMISKDGSNAHVYNATFNRYGSFFSVKNFKAFYLKHGEKLNMDEPDTFKIGET